MKKITVPTTKTFDTWSAALARAEKLLKAGQISRKEYDRIKVQAKGGGTTAREGR